MQKHILTKMTLLNAQVCSEGTWDEALEWIRSENPAGTTSNWVKDESEEMKPVKCDNYEGRTHYIFNC